MTDHAYKPDPMLMGDCSVCGHTREAHERADTPDMIPRSQADAEKQQAVAAGLREAAHLMPRHYGVWSSTGIHIGTWDDGVIASKVLSEYPGGVMRDLVDTKAILALIPDAGGALERALTAERERWIKEGMRIATTVPIEEIPQAIAAAIRAGEGK